MKELKIMEDPRDHGEKEIGDVVELSCPALLVYLIDYDTKEILIKTSNVMELYNYEDLIENTAVVVELDIEYTFFCNQCPNEHTHNCVIYYPHNGKKYYTDVLNIKVVK